MNELGRIAMSHWERFRPEEYRQMPNPRSYFTQVGLRAQEQVILLAEEMLRREPSKEDYVAEVGRQNMAKATAREMVLADLLMVPASDEEKDSLPSPVDPSGMPADPSHPLWGDLDNDEVSPKEFQERRAVWIASLPTR